MEQKSLTFSLDKDTFFLNINNKIIGISCLEISSASGSINIDENGIPKYNASMLLAIRSGMEKGVNLVFEGGAFEGKPFLRFFINLQGHDSEIIKEILRREATRVEAVLLASLNMVDLRMLEDDELLSVIQSIIGCSISELSETKTNDFSKIILLSLRGNPRVHPIADASQIGTFISTIMKQGYSTSMSCVFSAAKPGRERRKLEGKWKTIQSKEKRKEETLKDHALKKKLIVQYEEIQDDLGWFDSSVYFIIKPHSFFKMDVVQDGVSGIVQSIWGGHETVKLDFKKISRSNILKILTRKHLRKQRIHVSQLVAFVNTPVRKLPIIGPEPIPMFPVPPQELMSDELVIGNTIFDGRTFSKAGLRIESLREHIAVLGATGTGKTTLVKNIIVQLSNKTNIPWWIFDVKGSEYEEIVNRIQDEVLILKPGLDNSFKISLLDSEIENSENSAYSTFIMLRELLKERGDSSELSPAMEKLLRESVLRLRESLGDENSIRSLIDIVNELATNDRTGQMTRDALLNRLQILFQEPLSSILSGGSESVKISNLLSKRVILDLSYVARNGGMDSARILYNLVAKRIFEYAMKRGIVSGLHHVVILEEANNLVPESYSKHSSADVTAWPEPARLPPLFRRRRRSVRRARRGERRRRLPHIRCAQRLSQSRDRRQGDAQGRQARPGHDVVYGQPRAHDRSLGGPRQAHRGYGLPFDLHQGHGRTLEALRRIRARIATQGNLQHSGRDAIACNDGHEHRDEYQSRRGRNRHDRYRDVVDEHDVRPLGDRVGRRDPAGNRARHGPRPQAARRDLGVFSRGSQEVRAIRREPQGRRRPHPDRKSVV